MIWGKIIVDPFTCIMGQPPYDRGYHMQTSKWQSLSGKHPTIRFYQQHCSKPSNFSSFISIGADPHFALTIIMHTYWTSLSSCGECEFKVEVNIYLLPPTTHRNLGSLAQTHLEGRLSFSSLRIKILSNTLDNLWELRIT